MMQTLLYVSTARLVPHDHDGQVTLLADNAAEANLRLGLTGALIFTGTRFAQLLEGPTAPLDALAERIVADQRHSDIKFLTRRPLRKRAFHRFALVYSGTSVFVSRIVSQPLAQALRGSQPDTDRLIRLMLEFSS